jgi:hypothetical protein
VQTCCKVPSLAPRRTRPGGAWYLQVPPRIPTDHAQIAAPTGAPDPPVSHGPVYGRVSPSQSYATYNIFLSYRAKATGVIYFERSRNVPGPRRLPDGRDGAGLGFVDVDGGTEGETRNGRVEGTRLAKRAQATCDTSSSEAPFLPTFSVTEILLGESTVSCTRQL